MALTDELPFSMADASNASQKPASNAGSTGHLGVPTAFDAVFDSSGEALLIVDPSGVIQRANARARELLHLREASARRDLNEFLPPSCAEQLLNSFKAPGGRPKIDAALSTGFPVRITLRAVLPGAEDRLLLCLEEGLGVQRAEAKWRHADAELRSVLESVQSAVILYDAVGCLRASSLRFGEMFGLEARELARIGRFEELEEIVARRFRDTQAFSRPFRSFLLGEAEPVHDDLELARPQRRILERFSRPVLDADGRAVGWLELFTDVTGTRQIQSKMLQTEKMAALGQFVSGIAHELNNPLTAIMGYAQLLLGRGLSPVQLVEATKVRREAERARQIVKNLLYFARENEPERSRVHLNEIVERALALRSYELKVENILVECTLAPDLPETIADPHQLQQVVLNLVVNAEQALLESRGQGRILVRTTHVLDEAAFSARAHILLEVSDDGPGIPLDLMSRIFDPFFTTKPPGVGTGLGLSIVYGIVHQHGGEVSVENLPEGGTKFVVEIPVSEVTASVQPSLPANYARGRAAAPTGHILVVEDEPTVAQLVADVLREEGHSVETTLDSQDGLTRLARGRYDLVICDLRMPRLDGPSFFDSLVRTGSPMRYRILFVTGDTLAPRTLEFLEGNHLPYLIKPFLVEELKLAVHRLLGLRGGVPELTDATTSAKSTPAEATH
jgi:signal transduction histidine kinase/CheY-like chemotaxis protein